MTVPVLYLDNHLLVVDKPAGLLSQADDTGDMDVITWGKAFLKTEFNKPGNVFLGLVHRLDRPASGVMVLARTSKSASRLTASFKERSVDKVYLALVEGKLDGTGAWKDHLIKDNQRVRVVKSGAKGAKEARLTWEAVWQDRGRTLLRIRLETGRPHQIRVQCATRGYPLVGDLRYGAKTEFDGRNLALHSWQLEIDHPTRNERLMWKAALPETWPADIRQFVDG